MLSEHYLGPVMCACMKINGKKIEVSHEIEQSIEDTMRGLMENLGKEIAAVVLMPAYEKHLEEIKY
jgi:hypothetical protein